MRQYENKWFFIKTVTSGFFVILLLGSVADLPAEGASLPREITTASGVEMIQVPAGTFTMGDPQGQPDEQPHQVQVSSFYIDKYPVTQEEFAQAMKDEYPSQCQPSRWKDPHNPVEQISWAYAVRYCNRRSIREGLRPCYNLETWQCDFTADGYHLPTEAQWEYACRAGTTGRYFFGNDESKLKNYAWYRDNSSRKPHPVGQKPPNPWGLYDMLGNVWQWCNDFYKVDYYQDCPKENPRGPETGDSKVLRGGCWSSKADSLRCAVRYNESPNYADICFGYDIYGFRCVRNAPPPTDSGPATVPISNVQQKQIGSASEADAPSNSNKNKIKIILPIIIVFLIVDAALLAVLWKRKRQRSSQGKN